MKRLIMVTAAFFGVFFVAAHFTEASGGKAHWGYSGHEGPNNWGNLAPVG